MKQNDRCNRVQYKRRTTWNCLMWIIPLATVQLSRWWDELIHVSAIINVLVMADLSRVIRRSSAPTHIPLLAYAFSEPKIEHHKPFPKLTSYPCPLSSAWSMWTSSLDFCLHYVLKHLISCASHLFALQEYWLLNILRLCASRVCKEDRVRQASSYSRICFSRDCRPTWDRMVTCLALLRYHHPLLPDLSSEYLCLVHTRAHLYRSLFFDALWFQWRFIVIANAADKKFDLMCNRRKRCRPRETCQIAVRKGSTMARSWSRYGRDHFSSWNSPLDFFDQDRNKSGTHQMSKTVCRIIKLVQTLYRPQLSVSATVLQPDFEALWHTVSSGSIWRLGDICSIWQISHVRDFIC